MREPLDIRVDPACHRMRLDHYLTACFPEISRSQWQKAIDQGQIHHLGQPCLNRSRKICSEDTYTLHMPCAKPELNLDPEDLNLSMVYEDEELLVIDKPAGLVVHPGAGHSTGTLVNGLLFHCGPSLSALGGPKKPGLVHRLDKDTSGVMVVAKNDRTHAFLTEQFSKRLVKKTYWAFVGTHKPLQTGMIDNFLGRDPRDRQKMAPISQGGRQAITSYKPLAQTKTYGLLECQPKTGRTHQIRVHCAQMGTPILGDKVYGGAWANHWSRQALHARGLSFTHPSGQTMDFISPLPPDLAGLWILDGPPCQDFYPQRFSFS